MKKLLLFLLFFVSCIIIKAQNDSIAVTQMKEMGVYYFDEATLTRIEPIIPEGNKVSVGILKAKATLEFLGENSDNVLNNNPVFYVFIPSIYKKHISIKQFRMVSLTSKKGMRKLKSLSASLLKAKVGTDNTVFKVKKLNEECFKLYLDEQIEAGHYGIFYNYGNGVPRKLYDFDVAK